MADHHYTGQKVAKAKRLSGHTWDLELESGVHLLSDDPAAAPAPEDLVGLAFQYSKFDRFGEDVLLYFGDNAEPDQVVMHSDRALYGIVDLERHGGETVHRPHAEAPK